MKVGNNNGQLCIANTTSGGARKPPGPIFFSATSRSLCVGLFTVSLLTQYVDLAPLVELGLDSLFNLKLPWNPMGFNGKHLLSEQLSLQATTTMVDTSCHIEKGSFPVISNFNRLQLDPIRSTFCQAPSWFSSICNPNELLGNPLLSPQLRLSLQSIFNSNIYSTWLQ